MIRITDPTLRRLREVADLPDLSGTKYEMGSVLGRGGMGTVYRARDRELDRDVALKVLRAPVVSPEAASRISREAKTLARLEHPGIVPVHDVGRLPDGRIFYTMKLIRGRSLSEDPVRTAPLPERLRVFERICEAVAFAHAKGVIHRDLKPQNVMVGPYGEVLVMDWGLAKLIGEAESAAEVPGGKTADLSGDTPATATIPGTILGTPGYMAPEQARGEALVDARSDIHALGGLLHFLLTGAAPPMESLSEPLPIRDRSIPRPLGAIALKARAFDRSRRYQSVADLMEEIARFQAGSAVLAFPEGPFERVRRLAVKYRTPLLLVLTYLLMRILWLLAAGS